MMQIKLYNWLSTIAFASFILLVILQVSWLVYAAQSQRSIMEQNLEIVAPDIALKVNAIDHDAFHANRDQLHNLHDSIIANIVEFALNEKKLSNKIRYAIYDDSSKQVIKTNAPHMVDALIHTKAKACLSCIVSFSTIKPEQSDSLKDDIQNREVLFRNSTFQFYSPIASSSKDNSGLWFALYHPEILKETLGRMIGVFIGNVILLFVLLILFYFLLKSLSQYKAASKAKEEFFNNMTHEFKTPLSSIRLASRMLLKDIESTKRNEYLELIDRESVSLENQIDKILELSLLDNEVIKLKKEQIDLNEIINVLPIRLEPLIDKKGAHVNIELTPSSSLIVGDRYHLINAFSNLVENSLKYCQYGVQINIQTFNANNRFEIIIRDNGPGIPDEHRDYIFERFYRGQDNNQYKGTGFGIGLSYVQTIIKQHHGNIKLDPEYLDGTSFIITL